MRLIISRFEVTAAAAGYLRYLAALAMEWLLFACLSAFFAGATAVLVKIGVEGVDSNLATAIRTTVILFFSWAIALASTPVGAMVGLSRHTWLFLVLSGIATGLSWLCYFKALQLGPVVNVAAVDKLSLLFAFIFAVLFLHETAGWRQWTGALLILFGAIMIIWK